MNYGYQRTIKLLWHSNYWDGPISGVCEIDDNKFWFDQIKGEQGELWIQHIDESFDPADEDSYNYDITRFYKIYRLPDEAMNDLVFNHDLFRKYVGHHTDYVNNRRELGCHPVCKWDAYQLEVKKLDINPLIKDSNCIGWFDSNSR